MDSFEKDALKKGYKLVAGVDEAGRGPLAGPVVAAAVIFSAIPKRSKINDSKALTPQRREALVYEIYRSALSVSVGIVWPEQIDSINIHKASLLAMKKAVSGLKPSPDFLLIDGTFPIESNTAQLPVVSGDALSISIAAASIIAKTARDKIMEAYQAIYPGYKFGGHKGYATKEHFDEIAANGPTPIHRKSFSPIADSLRQLELGLGAV